MRQPLAQFLSAIASAEQCEILIAMHEAKGRWWSAQELAAEIFLLPGPTARDLESLATRGLLEVRLGSDVRYRFAPASDELAALVTELASMYRARRTDVLSFIVSRNGRAFRHFADAFRFRKEGE